MAKSPSTKTVFLSSTAKDLAEFRTAVHRAIESMGDLHCVRMEDFTAQPVRPEAHVQELVPRCDLFVGLLGLCYGSRPSGAAKSYTELEYDTAKEAGIPCLMFLCPEDFPVAGKILHKDGGWDDQQRFRDRVSRHVIRSTFETPEQLALQVVSAIRNWERKGIVPSPLQENIDCIILCGGYATRLWPLTIDVSKVLLPVAGRPVLAHVLDFVRKSPRIRRTILSTNQKFASQLHDFREEYYTPSMDITIDIIVEPSDTPEGKLGPVGALNYIVTQSSPRDLLVLAGDNLFGFSLEDFLRFAETTRNSANALYHFETSEDVSEYGIAKLGEDHTLLDFQEKQTITTYRYISTGCYLLRTSEVQSISKYLDTDGDPDSPGSFLNWLMSEGSRLAGFVFSSFWFDVGTREKLLEANWHYLVDSRHGRLEGSTIVEEPVQIEPGATIKRSRLGPNVYVGHHARIADSEIHNSIIMEQAVILQSRIVDSVVGPGSMIEGGMLETVCGPHSRYMVNAKERGREGPLESTGRLG